MSRSDLHAQTKMRLRTVGSLIEDLLAWGLTEEGVPRIAGLGRPQVPLSVRAEARNLIGVSLSPERLVAVSTGLTGVALSPPIMFEVSKVVDLVSTAAAAIQQLSNSRTLAIGVGVPGFFEPATSDWLLSSAHPKQDRVSLIPLRKSARGIPLVIGNELHALSAKARLTGRLPRGDSLLVYLDDGRVGASLLVRGEANPGSIMAANELGHTTMPVKVARCYCGQVGCVERIFSTQFLRSRRCNRSFEAACENVTTTPGAKEMIDLVGRAVANAVNFARPSTLLISSSLYNMTEFRRAFEAALTRHVLGILYQRLQVEWQQLDPALNAVAAAALPIAQCFAQTP